MNSLKFAVGIVCMGLLLHACGGGGDSDSGGGETGMGSTSSGSSVAGGFSGSWRGTSVIVCPTSDCMLDVDCNVEQTGAKIDGTCSTALTTSCKKFLPDATDKFTYPVSGNTTSFDLYSDKNAEGVKVTLESNNSITVSTVPFDPCTQPPFRLNRI